MENTQKAEKFYGYQPENQDLRSMYHDSLESLKQKPIVLNSSPKDLESISEATVDKINPILFTFSPNEVREQIDAAKKGEFNYIVLPGILVEGAFQVLIFKKDKQGNLKLTYDGVYRAPGSYPTEALNSQAHPFFGYGYNKALDFFKNPESWHSSLIKDNFSRVHVVADMDKDATGKVHSRASFYYADRVLSINAFTQLRYENEIWIINQEKNKSDPRVQEKIDSRKTEILHLPYTLCPKTQTISRLVADELAGLRGFVRDLLSKEMVQLIESLGLTPETSL